MKYREWWIGKTKDNFDKWLTKHDPELGNTCNYAFFCSDGKDKCVEYIRVIEYKAYEELKKEVGDLKKDLEDANLFIETVKIMTKMQLDN